MQPKLKEDPKEWSKFIWLCCGMLLLAGGILLWRRIISTEVFAASAFLSALLALAAWVKPGLFRPFYRAAMSLSFRIGQVMGKVILGVVYIFVVTPLGWILRLGGKDLLRMKGNSKEESYWKKARRPGKLDQQF